MCPNLRLLANSHSERCILVIGRFCIMNAKTSLWQLAVKNRHLLPKAKHVTTLIA